ncbi:TRAP transporter large permease [Petroclostridium sp. X23]|uniref:TRAP transporter large permease n=1 Tax=Petroclostridium sp. X23 TaxID=3045146 RepID=UPI0024AD6D40|nr:TRAP transporter large permease [Petroclostridium sp. X23]WHH59049.1 TRAP transporter large permease [Petroclostridium sp. X23]
MVAFMFISLLIFFLIGVPIALALGLSTALTVYLGDLRSLQIVAQQIFNSLNSFPLMAIPFFMVAGNLMQSGGISKRLVNFAYTLVGHITGGLAMVAIVTSMFFAAISGSGAATTAAVGSILIPAMIKKGYDANYASANQAVSGALGVIIPPSIPLILYGIAAKQSIGDLFMAGVLPGVFVTVTLLLAAYIVAKKRGYVGVERSTLKDIWKAFKGAIFSLLMPLIVLGGIYGGIFTPTEAAVVAVVYSLFIGFVVYKELRIKDLPGIFKESAVTTAVIMIIIGTAGLFSYIINLLDVPNMISEAVLSATSSKIAFLIVVNILLLITGMFVEAAAAILIFVPILMPVVETLGIDPIHFGVIMVVNLAMGMITPPVGLNLFVASRIANIKIERISKAIMPFVAILLVDVLIISFIPALSTWLPSLLR